MAGQAHLRVISPLAEGADRLMAEAGLAAGASLHCPLPFHRDEYVKDFVEPASKAAFTALLAQAERVLELDGEAHRREDAYAEIGRLAASRCDVLVAIWDGLPSRGRGGTAEVVAEALRLGVPVAHVDPMGIKPTVLLDGQARHGRRLPIEGLGERLDSLLTPPSGADRGDHRTVMRIILEGVGFEPNRLEFSRAHWVGLFSKDQILKAACAPCVEGAALEIFARADTLANDYAKLYRRTYWLNFVLGAVAVTVALIGARTARPGFAIAELIAIIAIIATTTIANARNWHERWIECRHMAEQLRPLRFLFPLGLALPRVRANPGAEGQEQPAPWADWLVRRIDVALGFPNAAVTPTYVEAVRRFAGQDVLEEQIRYHTAKAKRMRAADATMHGLGVGLFLLTALICALELLEWGLRNSGGEILARSFEAASLSCW